MDLEERTQVLSPDRFRHGQQGGTPAERLGISKLRGAVREIELLQGLLEGLGGGGVGSGHEPSLADKSQVKSVKILVPCRRAKQWQTLILA
jgi:hypothetical protein